MELVQGYIDIWQPSPVKVRENFEHYGYDVATISDGESEIQFGFKNMQIQRKNNDVPIYGGASRYPVSFARSYPDISIDMTLLLDNNDLYRMFQVHGTHLTLKTDRFKAQVYVEQIDYHQMSMASYDDILANVRFVSTSLDPL